MGLNGGRRATLHPTSCMLMRHRCNGSGGISDKEGQMSVAGTWALTIEGYEWVAVTLTLRVSGSGSVLTGSMSAFDQTADIYEGKLAGTHASWKVKIRNTTPLILEFASTIHGPAMRSGTVTSSQGRLNFTGTQTAHSAAAGIRRFTRLLGLARP